jgi:hypothetical protein
MLDTLPKPNDSDERKLWFDYIKTLNERQLQNAQRTGITNYVLAATLFGLVYRFGPQAPQFLIDHDKVGLSAILFVFEAVLFISISRILLSLLAYCRGASEFRAQPASHDAASRVLFGIFTVIAIAFAYLAIEVARSSPNLSRFGKWFLYIYAANLVLDGAYPLFHYIRPPKKAGSLRTPRFPLFRISPGIASTNVLLSLIWTIAGGKLLTAYVKTAPPYWMQCLKASSICLLFIAIVCFAFLRSIINSPTHRYFRLERDIVLNRLTPTEIRSRYLHDLSGPDMVQWLDDALTTLGEKEERLQSAQDSAQQKLAEIAKISGEYGAERRERARAAAADLTRTMEDCLSQHELLTSQTKMFIKTYRTKEETEALTAKGDLVTKRFNEFKEKKAERLTLFDELKKILEQS